MLILGTTVAQELQNEIRAKIDGKKRKPHLAVILVGDHPASHAYVNAKKKACHAVGIDFTLHPFDETILEKTLLTKILELNASKTVDAILVQSPLPPHLSYEKVIEKLHPDKDVDGFHPINMGKLLLGIPGGNISCTPLGIQVLLERSGFDLKGLHAVIVGRSNIVGKPLAALLMQKGVDATVTVAHSQTRNLAEITRNADVLIGAIGKPKFITSEMVKEGAIVIDVGINRVKDPSHPKGYRLVGDVDFENVEKKCKAITPVPKGVGPMTVAMLLQNTLSSYEKHL